jgi:DNA polymerase-3 subunit alpha
VLARGEANGRGKGRVTLVPRIDDAQEVEVTLPGSFQVTPRLVQAIKAVVGVERVEEV